MILVFVILSSGAQVIEITNSCFPANVQASSREPGVAASSALPALGGSFHESHSGRLRTESVARVTTSLLRGARTLLGRRARTAVRQMTI